MHVVYECSMGSDTWFMNRVGGCRCGWQDGCSGSFSMRINPNDVESSVYEPVIE